MADQTHLMVFIALGAQLEPHVINSRSALVQQQNNRSCSCSIKNNLQDLIRLLRSINHAAMLSVI